MLKRRWASLLCLLLPWLISTANSQSQNHVRDLYNRAAEHYAKGDFERAIADFTRVINLSSVKTSEPSRNYWNGRTSLAPDDSGSEITLIDPLTALAFAGRALA